MKFHEVGLQGAYLIEPELLADSRGWFARTFCGDAFVARGLDARVAQCSLSFNSAVGTLRGIHIQAAPLVEAKLVRVQRGAIWDVIVDLRRDSPTFSRWVNSELSAENGRAFYVPQGFGHAFITLARDTEVFYQMSVPHVPQLAGGIRWNDPTIGIAWPMEPTVISDKDRALPLLSDSMR